MGQVSRPLQIALLATLAAVAVWFVAVRGRAVEATSSKEPKATPSMSDKPVKAPDKGTGSGQLRIVEKAQKEQKASEQRAAKPAPDPEREAPAPAAQRAPSKSSGGSSAPVAATGAGEAGAQLAAPTAAKPKPTVAKAPAARAPKRETAAVRALPRDVQGALDAKKVLVLLFWEPKSSEDRAVRQQVAGISRHGGKVFVKVAPINQVGRYSKITSGARVLQSPTVLVIDREHKAVSLVGYLDRANVEQAVEAALPR